MKLLFPEAQAKQITALASCAVNATPIKVSVYHEPFKLETLTADMKKRATARIRVISDKELAGHVLSTESAIVFRKKVYETPRYKMNALEMLKNLSGKSHVYVNYWMMKNVKTARTFEGITETKVFFHNLDDEQLEGYVNDHDVVRFVGGYEPYNTRAIDFVDRIDGSLSGFIYNLPIDQVIPLIRKELK